jgi:hypothetical protein
MKFTYSIEEVAAKQLLEAANWYDEQTPGLGERLILHFEAAILLLTQSPFFEIRYKNLRVYNLKVFPYQIIYYIKNSEIVIVSFFHAHRDPEIWQSK